MEIEIDINLGDGVTVDIINTGDGNYRYDLYNNHQIIGGFGLDYIEDRVEALKLIYKSLKEGEHLF